MKKLLLVASLVMALIFVFTITPSTTDASTTRTVYKVAVDSIEVKSAAQDSAKKVVSVKKNDFVTVLSSVNEWSHILVNGNKGYVKTALLVKAKATNKQVKNKDGLKIYQKASTKTKVYGNIKQNVKVLDYGAIDKQFSFVQVGNVTGYALTASLKNVAAASTTSTKTVSFYQGLVPIGIKASASYDYFLASSEGYGGHRFDKFTYSGSKAKGTFSLKMSQKQGEYAIDKYSETKKGFTFVPAYNGVEVKIDYPAKVGNKKTYTSKVGKKSIKVTTTVKAVKGNFKTKFDREFKDVVVIQITGPNNLKADYIFKLNKGLIYSNYEVKYDDYLYGESLDLSGDEL